MMNQTLYRSEPCCENQLLFFSSRELHLNSYRKQQSKTLTHQ